jgi:hypothetical protein
MVKISPNRDNALVAWCGRCGGVVWSACRFVSDFSAWFGTRFGLRFVLEKFFTGGDGLTRQKKGKKITPTFVGVIFLLLMR